jgi:hypothetical protein
MHDAARWRVVWNVEKRAGNWSGTQIAAGEAPEPYERLDREGNMLMYGGAGAIYLRLLGGTTVPPFDASNAHLGIGDDNTAEDPEQIDLQAAVNKHYQLVDSVQHTDGTDAAAATVVFTATFGANDGNFAWNEWGIFNAASAGRMLNRKVETLGTKTVGTTWTLSVTITLS